MSAARTNERRFVEACTGSEPPASPVLALYRRLVRGNVLGVVRGVLPRTALARGDGLELDVDAFLRTRGPTTPHVRDVPAELVACVAHAWEPALRELARFELVSFQIGYAPRAEPEVHGEIAMDRALALRGPLALEAFDHAVQGDGASSDPHALLFYRDESENVRILRLSPMAHVLVQEALTGARFDRALTAAAAACELALDETTLASTARFLDDLAERGILLGALGP